MQNMFSYHNEIKLGINNERMTGKSPDTVNKQHTSK